MKFGSAARLLMALVLLVAVGLAVEARHFGKLQEDDRMLMRAALENVAQRIRSSSDGLRVIRSITEAAALAKAHAFARIIKLDPGALKRPWAFPELARTLDVDELHVSDEKGILIASLPDNSVGYDMASRDQSRVFMPAITNAAFELVQAPSLKGTEVNKIIQYAGVARQDRPGIVQVGFAHDRAETAVSEDRVDELLGSTQQVLGCEVKVLSRAGLRRAESGNTRLRDENGVLQSRIESDCGAYRVQVTRPAIDSWLATPNAFGFLFVVSLVLALLYITSVTGTRETFVRDVAALRTMFGGHFHAKGAFGRAVRNPVTLACAIAFVLAVGITWFLTARLSMLEAKARLQSAMSDMRESVNSCADSLLFYQGNAIVAHYRRPEAMTVDAVQELMARYGLDELNVVNGKGVVLAGALADVGYDMASNTNSAKFNCLLAGSKTYSQDFRAPLELPDGPKRKYAGVAFPWPVKGYIQMGFGEERLKHGLDFWFEDCARDWHIGERGYFIVADAETGYVKSCGRVDPASGACTVRRGITLSQAGVDVSTFPRNPSEFFTAKIFGEESLCLSEVKCFHRLVSVIPLSEIHGSGTRVVVLSGAVLLGVFVIVVFFMTKLTDLVTSLREKERLERERQEADLQNAKTVQASSLPVVFPDDDVFRIFARMVPAREVGGDFYDFYCLPSGRLFLVIADVSGKGIPAAMFMMKAKSTIRACLFAHDDLAEAVAAANASLADNNEANMFVTAWFGSYDFATGELAYVNAGHNPPLVKRADGSVEWIRGRRGLVLAAMDGARYGVERIRLSPGDSLLLYTDGVTEAMNPAGELYGEPRLESALRNSGELYVSEIRADVNAFVDGAEPSDDITLLAFDLKRKHSPQSENN